MKQKTLSLAEITYPHHTSSLRTLCNVLDYSTWPSILESLLKTPSHRQAVWWSQIRNSVNSSDPISQIVLFVCFRIKFLRVYKISRGFKIYVSYENTSGKKYTRGTFLLRSFRIGSPRILKFSACAARSIWFRKSEVFHGDAHFHTPATTEKSGYSRVNQFWV